MSYVEFEYENINNIHTVVMHKATRDSMTTYLDTLRSIMESLGTEDPYLALYDFSESGFPPLSYSIMEGSRIIGSYGRTRTTRILVIHNDRAMANVARTLLKPIKFLRVKFAHPDERDMYIDWLTTGDEEILP